MCSLLLLFNSLQLNCRVLTSVNVSLAEVETLLDCWATLASRLKLFMEVDACEVASNVHRGSGAAADGWFVLVSQQSMFHMLL